MPSAKLNDLVAELKAERAILVPQLEGLRDFSRLNIKEETVPIVARAIEDFDRRIKLIDAGLAALDSLTADGYPDVPVREVIKDVFADLQDNVSTINAAFTKFKPIDEAAAVIINAGAPQPKP